MPRIVLIEDNPADVFLVKMALEENGIEHTLVEFESGADALKNLCADGRDQERPDAIFLDLNTPSSDGFETLRRLRQRFQDVPITVLSSSRARSDKERAALSGAIYLEKDSKLAVFLASVASAVDRMLKEGQGLSGRAKEC